MISLPVLGSRTNRIMCRWYLLISGATSSRSQSRITLAVGVNDEQTRVAQLERTYGQWNLHLCSSRE